MRISECGMRNEKDVERGAWSESAGQPPLIGLLDAAPICPRLEKAGNNCQGQINF